MVEVRRNSGEVEDHHDLFSGLLDASQDELDEGAALSNDELIGKCFNVVSNRIFRKCITCRPRKHVYLSSCWT